VALRPQFPGPSESIVPTAAGRHTTYVVSGDSVAVGGTCGAWSYVQHIGATAVSKGWVESTRLTSTPLALPFDDGVPGRQDPGSYPAKWRIHVALVEGRGVPVCEAYLQRLNQTLFYEPPFCGIPDNDQIPGFVRLHAKPLTAAELNRLAVAIVNIQGHPPSNFVQKADALALAAGATATNKVYLDTRGIVPAVPKSANIAVLRYDPQVDVDNDGVPDNVVMFSGFTWQKCGLPTPNFPDGASEVPEPLVLAADNTGLDVARTKALFGAPWLAEGINMGNAGRIPGYFPIGYSITLFKYRDTYYFDAFMGEVGNSTDSRSLQVFRRTKERLEQICRSELIGPAVWIARARRRIRG